MCDPAEKRIIGGWILKREKQTWFKFPVSFAAQTYFNVSDELTIKCAFKFHFHDNTA